MTKDEYMEAHHRITESYLGLVCVALYRKDVIFELREAPIVGEGRKEE